MAAAKRRENLGSHAVQDSVCTDTILDWVLYWKLITM